MEIFLLVLEPMKKSHFIIIIGSGEKSWLYVGISYIISIISLVFLPTLRLGTTLG